MGADDAERLHQHGGELGDDRILGLGAVFAGAQPVEHPRPMHGAVAVIEQPEAHAGGAVVAIFDRAHELIVVIGLDGGAGFARDNIDGVEARKRVAQFLVQRVGRDRLASGAVSRSNGCTSSVGMPLPGGNVRGRRRAAAGCTP